MVGPEQGGHRVLYETRSQTGRQRCGPLRGPIKKNPLPSPLLAGVFSLSVPSMGRCRHTYSFLCVFVYQPSSPHDVTVMCDFYAADTVLARIIKNLLLSYSHLVIGSGDIRA